MGENSSKRERNEHPHDAGRGTPPGLADDRLYRALASRPRRRLLYYLLDSAEASVEELAEMLLGWEASGERTQAQQYDRTIISLRHTHLPALADAGLLAYDPSTATATIRKLDDNVVELVERSIAAEKGEG